MITESIYWCLLLPPCCPYYDNYNSARGIKTCQYASRTPASRAKLVVVFTEARAEGRQGRYKGRKAQAIQEEDKIRGKAMDKKQSYITGLLN